MIADFNLENWPIVYLKLNNNDINENSFEEYKKYYLGLLIRCKNNNEKMVLICNLNINKVKYIYYIFILFSFYFHFISFSFPFIQLQKQLEKI